MRNVLPYSVLPNGYDSVMEHVDYAGWVDHVEELLKRHGASPSSILELGCGTGRFAMEYRRRHRTRYLATDRSRQMIRVARRNAERCGSRVRFEVADFSEAGRGSRFGAALLLYDGLNYLIDPAHVGRLFEHAESVLASGALLIFDQTTPVNSLNNASYFEEAGVCDAFAYVRRSAYDVDTHLHETVFELETDEGRFVERHVQRAYTYSEIRDILAATSLAVEGAYADFSLKQADNSAERIHWVVRSARENGVSGGPSPQQDLISGP